MSYRFEYIVNPETGRKVNVNGKTGRRILNNYINQLGGAIRAGSRIPSDQYLQTGGHDGPCGLNSASGRCAKTASWDRVNCLLKKGRCAKNKSPAKKQVKKMVKKGKTVHPKKLKAVGVRVTEPKKSHKKPRKSTPSSRKTGCAMLKSSKKGPRISAKCYQTTYGEQETIGDMCSPAYSGGPGCLRLDKNNRPSWKKCNTNDAQTPCKYKK